MGESTVAKKLDRLLIREEMANKIPFFRHWVGTGGDSDHLPLMLELKGYSRKHGSPFKFNSTWLKEALFNSLVKITRMPLVSQQGSYLALFYGKSKKNEEGNDKVGERQKDKG